MSTSGHQLCRSRDSNVPSFWAVIVSSASPRRLAVIAPTSLYALSRVEDSARESAASEPWGALLFVAPDKKRGWHDLSHDLDEVDHDLLGESAIRKEEASDT
jgi:hypothetical protein